MNRMDEYTALLAELEQTPSRRVYGPDAPQRPCP